MLGGGSKGLEGDQGGPQSTGEACLSRLHPLSIIMPSPAHSNTQTFTEQIPEITFQKFQGDIYRDLLDVGGEGEEQMASQLRVCGVGKTAVWMGESGVREGDVG